MCCIIDTLYYRVSMVACGSADRLHTSGIELQVIIMLLNY